MAGLSADDHADEADQEAIHHLPVGVALAVAGR